MASMVTRDLRKTVALCIPSIAPGGAERQAIQLAQSLDERKWRVLVISFSANTTGLDPGGVVHLAIASDGIGRISQLRKVLIRERVQILQAYLLGAQSYGLISKVLLPNLKFVAAIRSSAGLSEIAGLRGKISHVVVFTLHNYVDHYVFNSSAASRSLGRRVPTAKRSVIFNGIDTARFHPDSGAGRPLREELALPPESRILGIVGNVNRYKGYDTFIRAAGILAQEIPHLYFVAVGEYRNALGSQMEALVNDLSLRSRFRFLGVKDYIERIIPGMDLLCSASSSEGFSNSIGEAMACGVPCVVTAVGDSAFIVGDTGSIVPPNEPAALAAAVRNLLSCGQHALRARGERARCRVEGNFGIRRMASSFESLYESLLARPYPGARPVQV
jgi:glycosyltransferase involved in cell wall biosynthesis